MSTHGWRAIGRAVTGLAALTILLVGVPVALAALAGWPLPRGIPDPAAVGRLLTSRAELPPDVVFKALALVGWAAWVEIVAATVVELVAFARCSHAPRLPLPLAGPVQAVAARLVAAAAMVLLPLRMPTSPAVPLTSLPFVHVAAVAQVEPAPPATATATMPEQIPPAPAREAAYTVKSGDWLSRIARTHLGAAQRWPEIYHVNKGLPQPDGRALRDPDLIRPGWHLVLPADAPGTSEAAAEAPAAAASSPEAAPASRPAAESDSNGGSFPASPKDAPPAPPASPAGPPVSTTAGESPSNGLPASPEAATPASPAAGVSAVEAPSNGIAPSAEAAPPSTPPDASPASGGIPKRTTPTPAPPAVVPSGPLLEDPATSASSGPQVAGPPVQPSDSVAPPSVAGPRTDETQGVPGRRVMAMAFAGLLTGGALLRLRKLRANQQRLRRRGRDIPRPPAELQGAEVHLRSIADEDAPRWVDAVSRSLSSVLRDRDLDPDSIPRIETVRIGRYGVELLLDGPHPNAAGPFRPVDADWVWRLDPAIGLEDLEALAEGQPAALPALLAVGETSEGPVLLDLERAGTLAVEGDPDRVSAFLAGAALELAAAPWATDVPLQMAGGDPALTALDGVEIVDAAALERRFSHADIAEPGRAAGHPLADRVRPAAGEHFAPTVIVVAPGAAPDATLTTLAAYAQPGSGVVLVAPGPIDGALWHLRIDADGSARLEPTGMDLTSGVSASQVHDLAALLAQAADEDDVALVVDLPPTSNLEGEPELWVRVLGPVEVDWPGKPPRPRSAELVVYLATHDERPVPGDRLRVALWPGDEEVAGATLLSTVSRARGALGEDHQGLPHLPDAEVGCYRLRPGVGCDWRRFRDLTAQARPAADAEATELLREALGLVRGAPFADPPKGAYGWALAELVSIIEVAVAEAAERLGDLALAAGDAELAVWSARQGLLACPGREALYQLLMRAADLAGNPDGVEAAWREVRRAVRAIDSLEEPRPDTVALYESLTRRSRSTSDAPGQLRAIGGGSR